MGRLVGCLVGLSVLSAACSKPGSQSEPVATERESLRDLSNVMIGRGYDRAVDIERNDCFDRKPALVTPVNAWQAEGFSAFRAYEIETKIKAALNVGITYNGVEGSLGLTTASRIAASGESAWFVMLARYHSHDTTAGETTAPNSICASLAARSTNGLADFVSTCGDSYLQQKSYGGHVLISWKRQRYDRAKDDAFGAKLGVKTPNVNIDAMVSLEELSKAGYGDEEIFIETSGIPLLPTPAGAADGGTRFTVDSAVRYLRDVASGATPLANYARVIRYELQRQTISDIDRCLSATNRRAPYDDTEFACVYDTMTTLLDTRNGAGDQTELAAEYAQHMLALKEYLPDGRLQFSTVPQSRCSTDQDGDPLLETGGDCAVRSLEAFVQFYESCQVASDKMLEDCRENVLGDHTECAGFQTKCTMPTATLDNGAVVQCDTDGLNAALAQVIDYRVNPPFLSQPPGAHFQKPQVLSFTNTPPRAIPNVTVDKHVCGITGVRGGLHESSVSVFPDAFTNEWIVSVRDSTPAPSKAIALEVTCTAIENFWFVHGPAFQPDIPNFHIITPPALNGGLAIRHPVLNKGNSALLGWGPYMSEPQTQLWVTRPLSTGFAEFFSRDLFPLESARASVGTWFFEANPGNSMVGGTSLSSVMGFAPGAVTSDLAETDYATRSTAKVSLPLPNDAFCYLTGVSGAWFNTSDAVRVELSDEMAALVTYTPLNKDRNPGARVECLFYDRL